ncbi:MULTISPECIES: ABC transporter ATP-binding protein [Ramlibacter]|uniref:ABC transporter ATP-binding protein n=1 Tax=Ramlibacter aquaticus TaxID=2780094 RepID=A0ABR9SIN7_9BURK|nr:MULTISPECIES: ABC transporter ATP-binding protein [Ramlibacter]MBE7942236.1 ABC transporter ATP-binding protein [Ramlibacter aquaticus]
MALLDVRDLTITLQTAHGPAAAVRDLSFSLEAGETLGIVGESGSGKSLTALALMGLLPESARATGSIRFEGEELLGRPERALDALRGDRMGMVFQEPMTALNPLHTVGAQVAEPLRLHRGLDRQQALREAIALLERVGIPDAAQRAAAYPHQFSGGQRQRIMIAAALACGPRLLLADEPTTALDVTVQKQILELMADLVTERGMALVLISHDLGVIAQNVRRMLVMYGGTAVETGPTAQVFAHPAHPYTLGLLGARPALSRRRGERLATLPGSVPELAELPAGCRFAGRCPFTAPLCESAPPPAVETAPGQFARCVRLDAVAAARQEAA